MKEFIQRRKQESDVLGNQQQRPVWEPCLTQTDCQSTSNVSVPLTAAVSLSVGSSTENSHKQFTRTGTSSAAREEGEMKRVVRRKRDLHKSF